MNFTVAIVRPSGAYFAAGLTSAITGAAPDIALALDQRW